MKSLADQVLDLMGPLGVTLTQAAVAIGEPKAVVRAAFGKIDADRRATLVRRGKGGGLLLLPTGEVHACKTCQREFMRGPKSKRVTCSRHCAVALGWVDPQKRANKIAGIKRQRATPAAKRKQAETNGKRWSDPKQRERLSEWNKKRWADPITKAELSSKIRVHHSGEKYRKKMANLRKADWEKPEYREKMTKAVRTTLGSPEYRAKFSKLLRERWQDPKMRAKFTEANKRRNDSAHRKRLSERMKAWHKARREARAK